MHQYIRELAQYEGKEVTLKAWVSNRRDSKQAIFLVLRDGSGFAQAVVGVDNAGEEQFELAKKLPQESSITLIGTVVKDERQIGGYEIQATSLDVINIPNEEYPISNKEHGINFLEDRRHLWLRSRKQWAIMRVRNAVIMAIHDFFQQRGFVQMDAPILTGNACEGTTELFETDFYDEPAYLSQSGQLYGEAMAMAQGLIYTFGPTFRAEKSVTRRHLSEFWMIEPEMAFYDNEMNMNLIEDFIKHVANQVMERCSQELEVLDRDLEALKKVNQAFPRISYSEAVPILRGEEDVNGRNALRMLEEDKTNAEARIQEIIAEIAERQETLKGGVKKGVRKFNETKIKQLEAEKKDLEELLRNIPNWYESAKNFEFGEDLGGSDETILTRLFDSPIMVYNWPAKIKSFYMKEVDDNPEFVKGVDVLAPEGYGEIIGGSEREISFDVLKRKIEEHDLPMDAFEWYLDLRRFGSVPHSGFGLGLERFVCWMCGIHSIREAIPFPRRYKRLLP